MALPQLSASVQAEGRENAAGLPLIGSIVIFGAVNSLIYILTASCVVQQRFIVTSKKLRGVLYASCASNYAPFLCAVNIDLSHARLLSFIVHQTCWIIEILKRVIYCLLHEIYKWGLRGWLSRDKQPLQSHLICHWLEIQLITHDEINRCIHGHRYESRAAQWFVG